MKVVDVFKRILYFNRWGGKKWKHIIELKNKNTQQKPNGKNVFLVTSHFQNVARKKVTVIFYSMKNRLYIKDIFNFL